MILVQVDLSADCISFDVTQLPAVVSHCILMF